MTSCPPDAGIPVYAVPAPARDKAGIDTAF